MDKLIISPSPHIRENISITRVMWTVFLTLVPAGMVGVWVFGVRALYVIAVSVATAILTEAIIQRLCKRPISAFDGSSALTGLLLAYNLPSNIPLWMVGLGSFFAVAVVKQAFGGLGKNIFNPALAGRVFLQMAYPVHMSSWPLPWNVDAVTGATALEIKNLGLTESLPNYTEFFIGSRGGCIGEISVAFLLVGALVLLYKGYIRLHIPISFIGTVALFTWVFGGEALFSGDWLFHILAGGLVLGAFFMATDMVTSPVTKKGMILFGFGCGVITSVIRLWGGYPEGVSYSILLMNAAVPMIDRYTKPRRFGT